MLEVSKVNWKGQFFLKCQLRSLHVGLVHTITSIPGWFKGREHLVYGLPFGALQTLNDRTRDMLVIWKLDEGDQMGTMSKGIDTSDISENYIVPYQPKQGVSLAPHQIISFNLLMQRDGFLIADEEGVGKTAPVLCSHEAKVQYGLIKWGLFVTKSSATYDVQNQARRFTNMKVVVIKGSPKKRQNLYHDLEEQQFDMVIISYELLRKDIDHIRELHRVKAFGAVYADEFHKVKDTSSQQFKALDSIESNQRYPITASPVINTIEDLFSVFYYLRIIRSQFNTFRYRYLVFEGYNVVGYKNLGEIKVLLQSTMLRRLKTEVLKNLPPVNHVTLYVPMTAAQKRLYKAVEVGDLSEFEHIELDEIPTELARHGRLAQVAESAEILGGPSGKEGSAKLAELEEALSDVVARGEKAVVFSRSKVFVNIMYKYFQELGYNPAIIHGDISAQARAKQDVSDRQAQVDKLQEDDTCKVIFCCEQAAREAWTGTEANNLFFTSKPWSPAYVRQCIGRVYRFGAEKHKSINVTTICCEDTVDERVELLLTEKQYTIGSVVEQPITTKQILDAFTGKVA